MEVTFYLLPSSFFFSEAHLSPSSGPPRGRWAGSQAQGKLGGREESPRCRDHQLGAFLPPLHSLFCLGTGRQAGWHKKGWVVAGGDEGLQVGLLLGAEKGECSPGPE